MPRNRRFRPAMPGVTVWRSLIPGIALLPVLALMVMSGVDNSVAWFVKPADTSGRAASQITQSVPAIGDHPAGAFRDMSALTTSPAAPQSGTSGPAGGRLTGTSYTAALTASGIPVRAYQAYLEAAKELAVSDPSCHLSWSVLAGIGRVESNHGRFGGSMINANGVVTPSILGIRLDGSRPGTAVIHDSDNGRYDGDRTTDRAVGPMQFLPGTWKLYGAGANPQNMLASALAAGRYLCAGGASLATQQGRWAAVYRYNHSDSYVSLVLSLADSYLSGQAVALPARPPGTTTRDDGDSATPDGDPPAVPPPPRSRTHDPRPVTPSTTPTVTPTATRTQSPTPAPSSSQPTTPATTPSASPTTTTPTASPTPPPSPTTSPTPTPTGSTTPAPTSSQVCTTGVPDQTPVDSPSPSPSETATPISSPSCTTTPAP